MNVEAVPSDGALPWTSALYEGTVSHARLDATAHAFRYSVLMAWLALDELPGALDAHPLWSARRTAPMRFRREDFHGDPALPLDEAVRRTIAEQSGERPTGPICLLAHLRTWGWSFNPIAFYAAFDPDGSGSIDALLAEVTNTPWGERHAYVMAVGAAEVPEPVRFPKALHVSPFLDLDLDHSFAFSPFGAERMTIRMDDWRGEQREFAATLDLHRHRLDRPTMGRMLRRHPAPAQRVSGGIYLEALKLRAKGAPFRRHPTLVGPARRTASLVPPPTTSTTPAPRPALTRSTR